ncbi:MAG: hypothetical protein JRH08_15305 [Deltaproteobacteria bacterium]|nr:hypothetical protein [Deltaproteobacteria bacterium]
MKKYVRVTFISINLVREPIRRIHFHLRWISELVIHIAEEVDKISKNIPLPQPSKWWVDVFCFRWNWSFPLNLLTIERRGGKRDGKTTTEVYG